MAVPLLQAEGGKPPARVGLAHPSIAPYGAFAASDGAVFLISVQSEREWKSLCTNVLDDPALPGDPRFCSNVARVENREATDALVADAFARRTGPELRAALEAADMAFAQVNDMAGLSQHPHLRRVEVGTPNGPVRLPAPGPIFSDGVRGMRPVPGVGEGG